MSWRLSLFAGVILGVTLFLLPSIWQPDVNDEIVDFDIEKAQVRGDINNFPTPMSWWRFGAYLYSIIQNEDYDKEKYGDLYVGEKPYIVHLSWVNEGQEKNETLACDRFSQLTLQLRKKLKKTKERFQIGTQLVVDMVQFLGDTNYSKLDRSQRLKPNEGLAIGAKILTPRQLLAAGVLSQSGEVRQEVLSELFDFYDPRRAALLTQKPLIWAKLSFNQMWLDKDGIHLPRDKTLVTSENMISKANELLDWLEEVMSDLSITLVRPEMEKPRKSQSFNWDILRLQAILDCPMLVQTQKERYRKIVKDRHIAQDGWYYEKGKRYLEHQFQAALLGLMDGNLNVIDSWFNDQGRCRVPKDFIGHAGKVFELRYAFFRGRNDWIDGWVARHLGHLSLHEDHTRKLFPLMCRVDHPELKKWAQKNSSYFLLRNDDILNNTRSLFQFLEGLRATPVLTYQGKKQLIELTQKLLSRTVERWQRGQCPLSDGGVRAGYLSSTVSVEFTLRAVTHFHWMLNWLQENFGGQLPHFEGKIKKDGVDFYINSGPMRYIYGALPQQEQIQSMNLSGVILPSGTTGSTNPLGVPVYCSSDHFEDKNFHCVTEKYLIDPALFVENKQGFLIVHLLTPIGEVVLSPIGDDQDAVGKRELFLNIDQPLDLIKKLYDRPGLQGQRLMLY